MKLQSAVLSFVFGLLIAGTAQAADFGFIEGNLWFSKNTFFSGETVRIYSAVFNRGETAVAGQVEFYDNDVKIGTADFSEVKSGVLKEVRIDWQATEGNHVFSAKIVGSSEQTGTSSRFIDTDTDHDGIGNTIDTDDDNDGLIDTNDSEPLTPGTPNTSTELEQASTPGFTAEAVETVKAEVDTFAGRMATTLKTKETQLRAEIAELKAKEGATEQTEVGQQINEAEGDENFVPATKPTGKPSDTIKRIGKQLYLFLIVAAIYILEHPVARYIAVGILALFLLRLLWRALRH